MRDLTGRIALALLFVLTMRGTEVGAQSQPDGQLTIAFDASIAPSFLDPAETPGIATPFSFLYALHDALIKPLPGNDMAPCLAESWRESPDGLAYEFKLREDLKFHNGDLSLLKSRSSRLICILRTDPLFGRSWSDGLESSLGH